MVSLRQVPLVGLLALLPVALYTASVFGAEPYVAITLLNVVLITVSVVVMFLPSEATVKDAATA